MVSDDDIFRMMVMVIVVRKLVAKAGVGES